MGRRHAYALAIGAGVSLFISLAAFAQPPQQQPGGPAVPAQAGSAPGLPSMPGGAPGAPVLPGSSGAGNPVQPGGGISRPGGSGVEQLRQPQSAPAPQQRWRDLSPQDRQRLQMNAERWQQMDAEERRAFREQQAWRQMRLKREAEAAMRESGLQLEAERRANFERRYIEERRRIDQELRKEIREKRQRELAPVVERLKKEFSEQGGNGNGKAAGSPKKQ